jgi:hypothetical protein
MGRNAHKNTWPVAQLPFQADPQNRRFPECGKPFFVLADTSDSSGYKNDVRGVYLKRALNTDTIDFYVEFNGVQLTPLGSPVYFPNDPLVAGFVVDWRQHLAITGPGCYRIKVEANLAGLAVDYYEGSYNVQPWSIDRAMGTVRLYSKFDSYNREKDVNFKESGFIDSIRFNGFFGKMQPNTEVNNLIGVNRELRKVTRRNDKTYELQSDPLNICHTKRIIDDHLIDENLILVCDHNAHNHSYEYRDLGCIVDEVGEVNYNEGRGAVVNATFKDKYALNKSMFINGMMNGITPAPPIPTCDPATWTLEDSAGNTLDSGSIVSGGSETITAPDTDLEINGTPEGSFTAGSTIDLQLTDGVNPVNPVSVGRVGDTVTVEVPKDLELLVPYSTGDTTATFTIVTGSAGTITAADTTGLTSVTYEVNATPETLPFTLVVGDVVKIDFDAAAANGVIKLTGSYA